MLDNLKNFVARLIYEEDITMFTHNLNDEGGLNIVSNLILVRNSDFNDSIVSICSIDSITAPCKYFLKTMIKVEG